MERAEADLNGNGRRGNGGEKKGEGGRDKQGGDVWEVQKLT